MFPTRNSADKVLMPYYEAMGFKETGLFSNVILKERSKD